MQVVGLAFALSGCSGDVDKLDAYPQRPIKLVVPFGAGGGTDNYARVIKKAFDDNDLLPQPLVIINRGGAGATIGSRYVKDSRPDGYTVLLLHDAILSAKASKAVSYGPEAFEPVAGTGEVGMVIAVRDDSPYQSLGELMEAARQKPKTLKFGANLGALTHYAGLMLEKEKPGSEFLFAQIGGGAQRFADLIGGHIDVTGFSFEEYTRFQPQGVRGLAFFGAKRHLAAPDLPTAREQGFDIVNVNTFYWWFPKGTPPRVIEVFSKALERALETDYVQAKMNEIQYDTIFITGDELQRRIETSAKQYEDVAPRQTVTMPNVPAIMGSVTLLLFVAIVWQTWQTGGGLLPPSQQETAVNRAGGLALVAILLTAVYVAAMSWGGVGLLFSPLVYLTLLVATLAGWNWRRLPLVLVVAVVIATGVEWIFKGLFELDLP